jgi:hypothetical protein
MKTMPWKRGWTSAAIGVCVGVVFAVVVFPGVGMGAPTTSHGGSPSDVYMKTQPAPEECVENINPDSVTAFPLEIEVPATSHVLAYFTFEWHGLERGEAGLLNLVLDGTGSDSQYDFARTEPRINTTGTVMWSFPNVASGTHTLEVFAWIDQVGSIGNPDLLAGLENCSLTAFVMPAA